MFTELAMTTVTTDEYNTLVGDEKEEAKLRRLEENLQVNTSGLDVDDDEDDDNYDKSDEVGGFRIPIVRNYSFNRAESPRRPNSRSSDSFRDPGKRGLNSPSNVDLFVDYVVRCSAPDRHYRRDG